MSQVQKISNRNFWDEWGWNKFTAKTFSVDSGEVRKVLVMMGIFSPCFACLSSTSFLRCCNLVSQTCMAQLSDHMSIWFLFTTLYGLSLYFQVMRNPENISNNENYIKWMLKNLEETHWGCIKWSPNPNPPAPPQHLLLSGYNRWWSSSQPCLL